MPTKQRRYPIKTKEAKTILEEASKTLKLNLEALFGGKPAVEVVESEVGEIYLVGGKPMLFKAEDGKLLPTLLFSEWVKQAPKITVDMGAVPYVCKGATVMAPGIVHVEGEFQVNDLAVISDVKFGKALAVGETILDAQTARATKKGPVVKNRHFVGDKMWDYIKTLVE